MKSFRGSRTVGIIAAVLGFAVLSAGCSTSGRHLEPPSMSPLPPTSPSTTLVAIEGDGGFALSSAEFPAGGTLPADIGAQSGNVSPALSWTSTPESAAELALVATNDSGSIVYWLVTGLVTTDLIVERGTSPAGGVVRPNTSGIAGWTGPVPSADGAGPVTVVFRLHALVEPLAVDAAATPAATVEAIARGSFATATLTGTFGA